MTRSEASPGLRVPKRRIIVFSVRETIGGCRRTPPVAQNEALAAPLPSPDGASRHEGNPVLRLAVHADIIYDHPLGKRRRRIRIAGPASTDRDVE
jgi:hypothetical protein